MSGENLDHLPKLSELNICGVTPLVEPFDEKGKNKMYKITPRSGGVGTIEVYINSVIRKTLNAKNLKLTDNSYLVSIEEELINKYKIPNEEVSIKIIAKTANNSISSRGIVLKVENNDKAIFKKPSLHAVMIGVDDYKGAELDLNYAAKDANDLHAALYSACKKYFNVDDTNRVHFYNLTVNRNGKSGTENIQSAYPDMNNIKKQLLEIEKTSRPEDIFILFFAGHGEIVDKDQLLLLTAESSRENFKGIRMRELLEQMNRIPAGKRVLILDACHSGAAINNLDLAQYSGKRDVKDAERQSQRLKELEKLASKSGFAIITASSSDQKALELPQYEHGLLTYALLNSMLNNKDALDEDNKLQLERWLLTTEEEVKKLNNEQSAERLVPVNFTLGKVDDEVRNSIRLREVPTVFIKNVLNDELKFDDLELFKLLDVSFLEKSRGSDGKLLIQDSPSAIQVNVSYSIQGDVINANIVLIKNKKLLNKFTTTGETKNLQGFVQKITNEIIESISN
jgi:hypothetical protein